MYKTSHFTALAAAVLTAAIPFGAQAALNDGSFEVNAFDELLHMGAPYYTGLSASGDIASGSAVTMHMPLVYEGDEEKSVAAIVTITDENNSVKSISYESKTVVRGDTELTAELASPDTLRAGKYTIKTYLWDNIDFKKIYCEDFKFSPGNNPDIKSSAWNIGRTFSLTSKEAAEGLTSLAVQSDGGDESVTHQETKITHGRVYRLDFAAKGDSCFGYDVTDSDMNSLIGGKKYFNGSNDWSFPSDEVFYSDEDKTVKVIFYDADANGTSYIDSAALTTELISNGGFEYGDDGFIFKKGCEITDEYASGGEYCAKINKSSLSKKITLIGNNAYNVSCDLRGDMCYVLIRDESDKVIAHKSLAAGDFENTEFEFYAPSDGLYTLEIMSNGTAYADNLCIWQTEKNLISNSDCEEDFDGNWKVRGQTDTTLLTRIEGAESRYGVMLSGRPYYYTGLSQSIFDKINNYGIGKYKITGYVKYGNEIGKGTVNARFMALRGNTKDGTADKIFTEPITGVGNEWLYFEKEFDIDSFGIDASGNILDYCSDSSTMNGVLYFETASGDICDICVSDVRMEAQFERRVYPEYDEFEEPEVTYWSKNIIENGDFENGSTEPWKIRGSKTGVETSLVNADGADGSLFGMKLQNRPLYYTGVYQSVREGLNRHGMKQYKISGYVRFDDDSEEAGKISLRLQTQAVNAKAGISKAVIFGADITGVTNEWTYFEKYLDVNSFGTDSEGNQLEQCGSAGQDGVLYFETPSGNLRDFCIDDIRLVCQVNKDDPYADVD